MAVGKQSASPDLPDAIYVYALGLLKGVGSIGVLRILREYRSEELLRGATAADLDSRLGARLASIVNAHITDGWRAINAQAREVIERNIEAGIAVVPIMSAAYPPLLTLVPDAPPLLYATGNVGTLQQTKAVAVVGSRKATGWGLEVAERVAKHFAMQGYTVISGLAAGIDTAAHEGTLREGGATIAVMPGALDKVYPPENKALAAKIAEISEGALVSEWPIGTPITKAGFVRRDRIQAGLSLGVIVVQSAMDGGAMHTARFAQEYGRLLLCPHPNDAERDHEQNGGIVSLLESGSARGFDRSDYPTIERMLEDRMRSLMGGPD